jgi:hypothetical protein
LDFSIAAFAALGFKIRGLQLPDGAQSSAGEGRSQLRSPASTSAELFVSRRSYTVHSMVPACVMTTMPLLISEFPTCMSPVMARKQPDRRGAAIMPIGAEGKSEKWWVTSSIASLIY